MFAHPVREHGTGAVDRLFFRGCSNSKFAVLSTNEKPIDDDLWLKIDELVVRVVAVWLEEALVAAAAARRARCCCRKRNETLSSSSVCSFHERFLDATGGTDSLAGLTESASAWRGALKPLNSPEELGCEVGDGSGFSRSAARVLLGLGAKNRADKSATQKGTVSGGSVAAGSLLACINVH